MGDNVSANSSISCFCVSGKARWCLNNVVVLPSAWSEKVRCGCVGNFEREKEVEMFKLKRCYGELIEKINMERISNIQYLPYEVISTIVNDDYIDVDKHLPWSRISVLVVGDNCDNDVTYLGLTINTDGDRTKIINVDRFYDRIIWSR